MLLVLLGHVEPAALSLIHQQCMRFPSPEVYEVPASAPRSNDLSPFVAVHEALPQIFGFSLPNDDVPPMVRALSPPVLGRFGGFDKVNGFGIINLDFFHSFDGVVVRLCGRGGGELGLYCALVL